MIAALAFSPDSRLVLTGGFSEFGIEMPVSILLWDVSSEKPLRRLPAAHMIHSAAFTPDGTLAATAGIGKTISIWAVSPL